MYISCSPYIWETKSIHINNKTEDLNNFNNVTNLNILIRSKCCRTPDYGKKVPIYHRDPFGIAEGKTCLGKPSLFFYH